MTALIVLGIIFGSIAAYCAVGLALRVRLTPTITPRYMYHKGDQYFAGSYDGWKTRTKSGVEEDDLKYELSLLQWLWPVMLWVVAARGTTHRQLERLDPARVERAARELQDRISKSEAENERLRALNDALAQRAPDPFRKEHR